VAKKLIDTDGKSLLNKYCADYRDSLWVIMPPLFWVHLAFFLL
jgi:hypothetical protein